MLIFNPNNLSRKEKKRRKRNLAKQMHFYRCKELFIAANHFAHKMAERGTPLDKLKKVVLTEVQKQNTPRLRNYLYPLHKDDVEKIAEKLAVSAWDWQQKKISEGTQRKINWGAMEFPKMGWRSDVAYCEETKRRQWLSAKRTHEMRSKKTYDKIMYAIFLCKADNIKITKTLIAQITGVRREELSRRYSYCFDT
jgi:hypothetical protein